MIKEHNNSTWQGKAYSKIVDTTQQVTSFPVVVRPMGNSIPSWTIKGNMVQDGTPSPSNIIYPSECGDRTANLSPISTISNTTTDSRAFIRPKIILKSGNTQIDYISYADVTSTGQQYFGFNIPAGSDCDTIQLIHSGAQADVVLYTITGTWDAPRYYLRVDFTSINPSAVGGVAGQSVMLGDASSIKPYEPYGYKLGIKSGNTTTPVYLGEVQSTRRIYKKILTGEESYTFDSTRSQIIFYVSGAQRCIPICTHYKGKLVSGWGDLTNGEIAFHPSDATTVRICDTSITSADNFKTYLRQQYSNGSPVCVWYVLANETTSVVNEPLRKIGTYSDSVSGTNLSVTAQSPTTIDVLTSLKPSEMDLTYTGKKMCGRKKYASLLADNPLCGIGTYKDTLDLSNGSASRYVRKTILTGTETISTQKDYYRNNTALFVYRGYTTGYNKRGSRNSHFVSITTNPQTTSYESSGFNDASMYSDYYYMRINYNTIGITGDESYADCVNAFKTWLAQQYANGTPVTIYYYVSTPTTETITVPSGLSGTEEGYLNQSGTPTPLNPIYPTANSVPYWQ